MKLPLSTKTLLATGLIGPPLFVIVFLVFGAKRPGYDPGHDFVSLFSLGDGGWMQMANFIVGGLLIGTFGGALHRVMPSGAGSRWGPVLIEIAGLGLILAGIFSTDPAQGYPPGAPLGLPTNGTSMTANVHFLAAFLFFGGLILAAFVLARRFRAAGESGWFGYSVASAIGVLVFYAAALVLAGGAEATAATGGVAGWLQRAAIVSGLAWSFLLAWRYYRSEA
ncbi:MAG: DUF998 domain-containing protein [Candidatus Limnocylindrales bacterium]